MGTRLQEDRISPLQDDLLCRILSRLPTEDIVATSALSTRWRNLYASVTDFYFSDSPTSGNATNTTNFVNFVSNVISAVQTTSKYFRKVGFSCTNGAYTCSVVGSWISAVSGPNLQDLEVFTLGLIDPVPLPPQLFLCRSLTRLRLKGTFSLCVPENVLFPILKSLDMCDLILPDHLSLTRLLNGCVVLEVLQCPIYLIGGFEVSIPSLKHLYLYNIRGDDEILLNTPNLESFHIDGYAARRYSGNILNSLVEAHLDINVEDGNFAYGKVSQLINMVSNARSLVLEWDTMTFFINQTTMFNKLTKLRVSSACSRGLLSLPNLLAHAPRLEVIELDDGLRGEHDDIFPELTSILPEQVPVCVSAHLKEVIFGKFFGEEVEFRVVEYFLKNAKVLEKMSISPSPYWDSDEEDYVQTSSEVQFPMTKRLLALPRWSRACQIVFAYTYY